MSIAIPKRIGYGEGGGNLPKLRGVLQALADSIDAIEIPEAQEPYKARKLRVGRVTLNGVNPSHVSFIGDSAAFLLGSIGETYDLSDGDKVLQINADGEGNETVTFTAVAGKHDGETGAAENSTAGTDNKFMIACDGDVGASNFHEIELTLANCGTGANTATEMQTKIRALAATDHANYAAAEVAFSVNKYIVTSGTKGQGSKVRIERATSFNITEELKLGPDGGADTDGLGVGQNSAVATAAEVAAFINEEATHFTANYMTLAEETYVTLYGKVVGGSLIVGNDDPSTANAILGFTAAEVATAQTGLGYTENMADDEYFVVATPTGIDKAGKAALKIVGIHNKAVDSFDIVSTDDASTFAVDLLIVGAVADPA